MKSRWWISQRSKTELYASQPTASLKFNGLLDSFDQRLGVERMLVKGASTMRVLSVISIPLLMVWAVDASETNPVPTDESVRQLVRQLDASDPQKRDLAEKDLVAIGPKTLEYLPAMDDKNLSAEQQFRLARIVPILREIRAKESLLPSKVTIPKQPIAIESLLQAMTSQTGNKLVDLRDELQQATGEISIDFLPKESTFWELMAMIEQRTGLVVFPNQEGPALGLAEGPIFPGPEVSAGPLRIRLRRVLIRRDYAAESQEAECILDLAIEVEPRLRPLQFQIPKSQLVAKDDTGAEIPPTGPDRQYLTLDEGATMLDASLRFQAPQRAANKLTEVQGSIELAVASESTSFLFDDLTRQTNVTQKRLGQAVTYEAADTEDAGLWGIRVIVEREDADPESYLQTELKNDAYLLAADGSRVPPEGGMNSQDLGDGRIQFEFVFVDVPGKIDDYKLGIDVPGRIVRAPIPFAFREIKLP